MAENIKLLNNTKINDIRYHGKDKGLLYKEYGRFSDIKAYTDQEISEMYYGIYKDKGAIIVDGDYLVKLSDVSSICCELSKVTYYKKPSTSNYQTNIHNRISNIRTFYIKEYYLESENEIYNTRRHAITRLLYKLGAIKQGHNNFLGHYSITNDYKTVQSFTRGYFPKDLYHPIKRYINGLFFNDDYRISDFRVESQIKIEKG